MQWKPKLSNTADSQGLNNKKNSSFLKEETVRTDAKQYLLTRVLSSSAKDQLRQKILFISEVASP